MFGVNNFNPYANNPYAVPYQPQIQSQQNQQFQNMQQVQSQNNNGIVWVQGEAGAKSFLVAPNNSVLLMDSENEYFYIKEVDGSNMPKPLRKFKYTEITDASFKTSENVPKTENDVDLSKYITREEFEEKMAKFQSRTAEKKSTKKEVEE